MIRNIQWQIHERHKWYTARSQPWTQPKRLFLSGAICDADRNSFDALFSMLDTTNLKARMRKYQIKHRVEEEEGGGDEEEEMKRNEKESSVHCLHRWILKFEI